MANLLFCFIGLICDGPGPIERFAVSTSAAGAERRRGARDEDVAKASETIRKSLGFLRADAEKWRTERECSTCHHGSLTVWAFSEAKARGFDLDEDFMADILDWTKPRFVPAPDTPPDLRPGYSIPSLAAVFLTLSSWSQPELLSVDEANRIAKHITDRQEPDGAWPIPPPKNGPPPVFESRETMAIWFLLGLSQSVPQDAEQLATVRAARQKAAEWLRTTSPNDTSQSAALRLLLEIRTGQSRDERKPNIERLLKRQNADGGWAQIADLPSDPFATGQALYVLGRAGVDPGRPEMRRAAAFLINTQKTDGSWPMTPRETPERPVVKNIMPIVYFGSAWATLGLIQTIPEPSASN